ncbi:MAG: MBL fold metallo-hydrolase [Lachnospiraceae bacterium]|nr:MBL fold metallo-hydrolase [Lachnospiraceae bacterium]
MGLLSVKSIVLSICGTNCYVLYDDNTKEGFIIDPADSPEKIIDLVTRLGVSIKALLLTHGHFDHIGATNALKKHYSVDVYAHEAEVDVAKDIMLNLSAHFDEANSVIVDRPLKDSQEFEIAGFKVKVIHTPGHTVGSCCYIVSDEKKDRLFSGDTIFYHSYGRTDLPTGSGGTIIRSILDKLLVLDGGMEVFPGHGDTTTIDEEKKWYRRDISGNIN